MGVWGASSPPFLLSHRRASIERLGAPSSLPHVRSYQNFDSEFNQVTTSFTLASQQSLSAVMETHEAWVRAVCASTRAHRAPCGACRRRTECAMGLSKFHIPSHLIDYDGLHLLTNSMFVFNVYSEERSNEWAFLSLVL